MRYLLLFSMFAFATSTLNAQVVVQKKVQIGGGGAFPFGQQMDPEEQQQTHFEETMLIRIDEIDRICGLSEVQTKKLNSAAKGAISRSMNDWKKQMKSFQKQIGGQIRIGGNAGGFNFGLDDDDEEEELDEEEDEESEDDELGVQGGVMNFIAPMMGGDSSPLDQRLWKNTLKSVLTDAQTAKLKEAEEARRKFRRAAGVRQKVEELDQQLRFTPDQREKVLTVVDTVLGKSMEEESSDDGMVFVFGDTASLKPKHLKDVLSDNQMKVFEKSEKDMMNPMGNVRVFRGAMAGRRALPLPGVEENKAYFGASFAAVGVGLQPGITIDQVVPDGPAQNAGLQAGDKITMVDDQKADNIGVFLVALGDKEPGDTLEVTYERDGEELKASVILEERP